jgi:pimeloyl-ACP methyl ester carboxylesterase
MDLFTHRWGTGSTRVLLIHGITSSGATWWQIAAGLEGAATVVAPDLRGHGASPRAERYAVADYAGDLDGGWDLVVGHSLGGLIAAYAGQDPGFARRIVLIDPVLEIADADGEGLAAANLRSVTHPATAAEIAAQNPTWHPETVRLKRLTLEQADPHAVERTMYDNAPWHHAALLHAVTTPTLILGGDPAAGALCDPGLGADNPHVEYRMVPGTGHSVHRERPDVVLAALLAGA